eukprot:5850208-Pleurochrysis_carterae.AAC.1
MHRFEPGMVVYNNERVAASSIDGGKEWTRDVHMNKSPSVRWPVKLVRVRKPRGVGFGAGSA